MLSHEPVDGNVQLPPRKVTVLVRLDTKIAPAVEHELLIVLIPDKQIEAPQSFGGCSSRMSHRKKATR